MVQEIITPQSPGWAEQVQLLLNGQARFPNVARTHTHPVVFGDITGTLDHGLLGGLADDDHTQYVLRSILTTRGDMFRHIGGVIARFGVGAITQILGSDGTDPDWKAQSFIDHGSLGGLSDADHDAVYVKLTGSTMGGLLAMTTGNQVEFLRPDIANQFRLGYTSNDLYFRFSFNTSDIVTIDNTGAVTPGSLVLNSYTVGTWTTPTFSAGDYTASAGGGGEAWTVASGDVTTLAYTIIGKMMTVAWYIVTTTVAGTPVVLSIKVPASKTVAKTMVNACYGIDNGTRTTAVAQVTASGTTIDIRRSDAVGWTNCTDLTHQRGQITFEIQ